MKRIINFYRSLIDSPRKTMTTFSYSAVVFFICLASVYSVNKQTASTEQEVQMLFFLVIGGVAFCSAIAAQICMIIQRLK